MKPSQKCKNAGLTGLTELSKLIGKPVETPIRWSKVNPILFEIVVLGAAAWKRQQENDRAETARREKNEQAEAARREKNEQAETARIALLQEKQSNKLKINTRLELTRLFLSENRFWHPRGSGRQVHGINFYAEFQRALEKSAIEYHAQGLITDRLLSKIIGL